MKIKTVKLRGRATHLRNYIIYFEKKCSPFVSESTQLFKSHVNLLTARSLFKKVAFSPV